MADTGTYGGAMKPINVKKGALHSQLGVPQGKKMTAGELQKAKHSKSALERKRANFALVARKWSHNG